MVPYVISNNLAKELHARDENFLPEILETGDLNNCCKKSNQLDFF
jgi:hypothetical protein